MKKYTSLLLGAMIIQMAVIAVWTYGHPMDVTTVLFYLIACVLFSYSGTRLLPTAYQQNTTHAVTLLLVMSAGLPFLGMLGIGCAVIWASHHPQNPDAALMEEHSVPELPFQPENITAGDAYSLGGLVAIIKHSAQSDKRLSAIMATRNIRDKLAIPILQLALKDKEDDIRLLAYASLDKKENALNTQIAALQEKLQCMNDARNHWRYQRQIAEKYWELSYLGLVNGVLRDYTLNKAAMYAQLSLKVHSSTATRAFLGRIFLAQNRLNEAEILFEQAATSALPMRHVYPYLAEIAFRRRNYRLCQKYLSYLPTHRLGTKLQSLREFWNDEE